MGSLILKEMWVLYIRNFLPNPGTSYRLRQIPDSLIPFLSLVYLFPGLERQTTVDNQLMACDIGCQWGAQEQHATGNILRCTEAATGIGL